jgi:hypothetical protein
MERQYAWHTRALSGEQYTAALQELDGTGQ